MRIRCASKMPKKCAYLNAFQKRIKCASEIRNQKILSYAFQMRFRCISKMLKRFDAKLETFQMRFVFTGNVKDTKTNDGFESSKSEQKKVLNSWRLMRET